jgi:hypothetical protein
MSANTSNAIAGDTALNLFTAGFYNSLVTSLNLDPKTFQLMQGAFPVPLTATALYNVFDSVPPASVANFYTPSKLNSLSGNIGNLIGYGTATEQASFQSKQANSAYMNVANWLPSTPNGPVYAGENPIYNPTMLAIQAALKSGSTQTFSYDSTSADTSLTQAWTQSSSSAGVGFWGTSSDSNSQQCNTMAESSSVTVTMTITYAMVPVQAGAFFFDPYFLQMYQNVGSWAGGQAQWDTLFGPTGSLLYMNTQALIVTNYHYTVTSNASYSASQYQSLKSNTSVNVWPFYTSSDSSSSSSGATQNSNGSITTSVRSNPGAVQIMGFDVSSVASLV